jgi:hypothetical protein
MKPALSFTLTLCLVGSALPAAPQEPAQTPQSLENAAWFYLTRLAEGEELRVVLANGAFCQGAFRIADDQSITLVVAGQNQRVSRGRVRRISVARGTHRRRNVLLGLAIGGAAGGLAMALHCRGEASACKEWAPVYINPAAGVGAAIGALLPSRGWQEIYHAQDVVHP